MHQNRKYIKESLELHLFFARIMKEHSLFLKAGLTLVDRKFADEAESFKNEFEKLLLRAVSIADGIISCKVLKSGELFTEFTSQAEEQTECFTGISINKKITAMEKALCCDSDNSACEVERRMICNLNQRALGFVNGLISLKERMLKHVSHCHIFTMNYPLLLEHVIREAKLYRSYIVMLEEKGELVKESILQIERFWNRIMMEHAMFIRGLLDPSENELVEKAHGFAMDYESLLKKSCEAQDRAIRDTTEDTVKKTCDFRDFKKAGADGITDCKIKSIILPLLADHVLREANHYLRLLCN